MKKLLLSCIFVLLSIFVFSQTIKKTDTIQTVDLKLPTIEKENNASVWIVFGVFNTITTISYLETDPQIRKQILPGYIAVYGLSTFSLVINFSKMK